MSQSYSNPPALAIVSKREALRARPGMYLGSENDGLRRVEQIAMAVDLFSRADLDQGGADLQIRRDARGAMVIESDTDSIDLEQSFGDISPASIFVSNGVMESPESDGPRWRRKGHLLRMIANSSRSMTIEEHHASGVSKLRTLDGVCDEHVRLGASSRRRGVRLSFDPDPFVVAESPFAVAALRERIEPHVVGRPGLSLTFLDEPTSEGFQLYYPDGTRSFVDEKIRERDAVHAEGKTRRRSLFGSTPEIFSARGTVASLSVDVTLGWATSWRGAASFVIDSRGVQRAPRDDGTLVDGVFVAISTAADALGVSFPRRRIARERMFRRCFDIVVSAINWEHVSRENFNDFERSTARAHQLIEAAVNAVIVKPLSAFLIEHAEIVGRIARL